jgi:hypothetical protein
VTFGGLLRVDHDVGLDLSVLVLDILRTRKDGRSYRPGRWAADAGSNSDLGQEVPAVAIECSAGTGMEARISIPRLSVADDTTD